MLHKIHNQLVNLAKQDLCLTCQSLSHNNQEMIKHRMWIKLVNRSHFSLLVRTLNLAVKHSTLLYNSQMQIKIKLSSLLKLRNPCQILLIKAFFKVKVVSQIHYLSLVTQICLVNQTQEVNRNNPNKQMKRINHHLTNHFCLSLILLLRHFHNQTSIQEAQILGKNLFRLPLVITLKSHLGNKMTSHHH